MNPEVERFDYITSHRLDDPDLVKASTYKKGGRAHSDIYKPEVGELLFALVRRLAP